MWPYFLFFLVPVGIAISPIRGDKYVKYIPWTMVGLLGTLFIGLRYDLGADWDNYFRYMVQIDGLSFIETLTLSYGNGPGYMAFNWLSLKLGLGMVGVNLICGLIFMTGLIKFCRQQPFPWVALAIAVPYAIIVVVMGLSRQGAALGLIFWALSALRPGSEHRFVFLVALASLLHFSALIVLPLIMLTPGRLLWWKKLLALFSVLGVVVTVLFLDILSGLIIVWNYTASMDRSGGAPFRIFINVLPVFVSIFFYHRLKSISPDYLVWKWLSIIVLCCVPLLLLANSTILDRLALYLIPVQVALWPRLIAVQKTSFLRAIWALSILFYSALILLVWLNFANTAMWWLPYQMWPFVENSGFYIH